MPQFLYHLKACYTIVLLVVVITSPVSNFEHEDIAALFCLFLKTHASKSLETKLSDWAL